MELGNPNKLLIHHQVVLLHGVNIQRFILELKVMQYNHSPARNEIYSLEFRTSAASSGKIMRERVGKGKIVSLSYIQRGCEIKSINAENVWDTGRKQLQKYLI